MPKFHVTYEIVTPESAEIGDAAERGYIGPYGFKFDLENACGPAAESIADDCAMGLREAVNHMSGGLEDCGHWFAETDGRHDYRTGAETRYSFHAPENVTAASYGRIARLLGAAK